jgi:demethylmenaquinone methyltransferase/2-methoxy-6-polyprenyl-1,4-benzoquinol methylase
MTAKNAYNSARCVALKDVPLVSKPDSETDFGFERVAWNEKANRVRGVFDSVADNYDLMNDLMSGGVHRLWKRFVLSLTALRPGQAALDVAGGTGDLTAGMSKQVGAKGLVVLSDINAAMLDRGRDRLVDDGIVGNVAFVQANAEKLPFADGAFDCVTIGFGLRNVTDKLAALAAMRRVLRPGGQLIVLEFSKPVAPGLQALYDTYSFRILPLLGKWVARDEASYRYLAESIRMHPDQEALLGLLREAGLEDCRYHNLTGGIVAVHRGYRY